VKKIKLGLVFLILLLLLSFNNASGEHIYKKSTIVMDTLATITVVADSDKHAESAIDAAFNEIKNVEKLISFWDPKSEISAINRNAGIKPVKVSPQTLELIKDALYASHKTDGAFDPTIGPVIRQWDFKKHIKPDPAKLKEALKLVNYKEMKLDEKASTAYLAKRGMSFDTGGIAKGYGADLAEKVLRSKGIRAGLIAIAGDIKAFGIKPDGHGWLVAIRNPREPKGGELLAKIELKDQAISTSGDYERYFIEGNKRLHHLLNPKTGYPAQGFQSVSVIAPKGVWTDGLSTGIFIMGPDKGIKRLNELGFGGILVESTGKLLMTDNIKKNVQVLLK
jgi:thiamine biosynthesis lipoprotein